MDRVQETRTSQRVSSVDTLTRGTATSRSPPHQSHSTSRGVHHRGHKLMRNTNNMSVGKEDLTVGPFTVRTARMSDGWTRYALVVAEEEICAWSSRPGIGDCCDALSKRKSEVRISALLTKAAPHLRKQEEKINEQRKSSKKMVQRWR